MKPASHFSSFLDRPNLRRLAGGSAFERDEDYLANNHVAWLSEQEGMITASVRGTQLYRVKLWLDKKGLDYSCNCPIAANGGFCKHCVAVGLAWLEGNHPKQSPVKMIKSLQ